MLVGFNTSLQGSSHIMSGIPCQDYSATWYITTIDRKQVVVSAVADGVGSCSNAHLGSKVALEGCLEKLKQLITAATNPSVEDMVLYLQEGFQAALDAVQDTADEQQMPVITFDTTLSVATCVDGNMAFGHCGDGGIIVLYGDGSYEMVSHRHKGEEATSVFPLRCEQEWEFGTISKPFASVALMTDGVLDSFVTYEDMGNMIYFPFLQPLMTARIDIKATKPEEYAAEITDVSKQLAEFAEKQMNSDDFRNKVHDDLSLAMILDSEVTGKLPSISFSEEEWQKKIEEYARKQKVALNEEAKKQAEFYHMRKKDMSGADEETVFDGDPNDLFMESSAMIEITPPSDYTRSLKRIIQGASMIVDAIGQIGTEIGTNIGKVFNEKCDHTQTKKDLKDNAAKQSHVVSLDREDTSTKSNKEKNQEDSDES